MNTEIILSAAANEWICGYRVSILIGENQNYGSYHNSATQMFQCH